MKLVNLAVLAFASCILAKNIIYLEDLRSAAEHDKREAKNIVSLDALKEDAENAVYGNAAETPNEKREAQEVLQPASPLLQSLLPQMRSISVFSGYLRNSHKMESQLSSADSFVLIVAPSDAAFSDFTARTGRKPWEYPQEVKNDESDDEVIRQNLNFLLDAHVSAPIDRESVESAVRLLNGQTVAIEKVAGVDNYQLRVDGGAVAIVSIDQAKNGIVVVVDTVLV